MRYLHQRVRSESHLYVYSSYYYRDFDGVDIREWSEGTEFINGINEELGDPTYFTPVAQLPGYLADGPFGNDGSLKQGIPKLAPECFGCFEPFSASADLRASRIACEECWVQYPSGSASWAWRSKRGSRWSFAYISCDKGVHVACATPSGALGRGG